MKNYTFTNFYEASEQEKSTLGKMVQEFFHMKDDPEQIQVTPVIQAWLKKIPGCATLIKYGEEVVGSTFMFPSTLKLMDDFTTRKINEAQLAEKSQQENITCENMEAIYLCSFFVSQQHRGHALSVKSAIHSIKLMNPTHKPIPLFYWPYSKEGITAVDKVAAGVGLKLFARQNAP